MTVEEEVLVVVVAEDSLIQMIAVVDIPKGEVDDNQGDNRSHLACRPILLGLAMMIHMLPVTTHHSNSDSGQVEDVWAYRAGLV